MRVKCKRSPYSFQCGTIKDIKAVGRRDMFTVLFDNGCIDSFPSAHLWQDHSSDAIDEDDESDSESSHSNSSVANSEDNDNVNSVQMNVLEPPGSNSVQAEEFAVSNLQSNANTQTSKRRRTVGGGQRIRRQSELISHGTISTENPLKIRLTSRGAASATYQEWQDVEMVNECPANNIYSEPTKFNWRVLLGELAFNREHSPIEFFELFFPIHYVNVILGATNSQIAINQSGIPIDRHQLYRYFGIRLLMAVQHCCDRVEDYFKSESDGTDMDIRPNYTTRFGISFSEFRKINDNLRLASYISSDVTSVGIVDIYFIANSIMCKNVQ